jgi:Uma2 family endonuclease
MPSSEELPDSDDTPIDDELQYYIPHLLRETLAMAWANRFNWFFARRMGIYYDPNEPAIVPDGFLSLGVERFYDENLRRSYVLWEEEKVPTLVLEVVSETYRNEYSAKKDDYADMGVLYYVIYNSHRRRKPRLEVHKLIDDVYYLQDGNPVWLPEVGLGIGIERGTYQGITREWLYWYNEQGQRLLTPEEQAQQAQEQAQQAQEQAQQAQERANRLAEQLKALGIDPDSIV